MGKEYVGIDLHRRRSVIYRMDQAGDKIDSVRVHNEPSDFAKAVSVAPVGSDVIVEATSGTGPLISSPRWVIASIWPNRTATIGATGG